LPKFTEKALPLGSQPLREWINQDPEKIMPVLEYLVSRGFDVQDYDWYWTDESGFDNRLIIPFYHNSRIVGWTARLLRDGKVKYISEQQPGYVFNLDSQNPDRRVVIVTEGPLDAVGIGACAVMTNEIGPQQLLLLKQLGREIIVCPDRDAAGVKMAGQAIELGLSVSLPDWPEGIKDINDAVNKCGKLYALMTVLMHKESMPLKIQLKLKKWIET